MAIDANAMWQVVDSLKTPDKPKQTTAQATVNRIDQEGRVWVSLPGGEVETPTESTNAEVSRSDTVTVEWRGGKLFVLGNSSNPSVGAGRVDEIDLLANQAYQSASEATANAGIAKAAAENAEASAADAKATADSVHGIAVRAQADAAAASTAASTASQKADAASTAASSAQTSAGEAKTAAQQAVADAATAGRAASVAQAAADAAQGDIDELENWFWHDTNGSHVLGATSGYRNDMSSTGMDIVEIATETSVAEFGKDGGRIGKEEDSHLEIDFNSLQLVDKEDITYFKVADMRDASGITTIAKTFVSDGVETYYEIDTTYANPATSANLKVAIDGVETTAYRSEWMKPYWYITLNAAAPSGSKVVVSYESDSAALKEFTFGSRTSDPVGLLSFASGVNVNASGQVSHAEGANTVASDACAHAEGLMTNALGAYSHAEGWGTRAGACAHAQNLGTEAMHMAQTAMGKYNHNKYGTLLEVGNGSVFDGPSNAFEVYENGDIVAGRNVTDGSGNVLADKADTTDLPTWESLGGGAIGKKDSLEQSDIPGLSAAKIVSGTLNSSLIPNLPASRIGSGTFSDGRIPSLDASKIGSGTFDTARIPDLDAEKIASGTLDASRIPSLAASKIGSGTFDAARIPTLPASKITGLGSVVNGNFASQSVANNTAKALGSISLAAGTWVITATAWFASNATGRREMKISSTSGDIASNYGSEITAPANGIQTALSSTVVQSPTATTSYYLNARQNSGSALNVVGYMRAVRIA